ALLGVGAGGAVAGDSAPDEARVPRAQLRRAEAEAVGGAWGEVLDEHIRPREQCIEYLRRARVLYIQREAFLRAVGPDKVRRLAEHGAIDVARSVARTRALDLDDARAQFRQLARAERPGDHLLQADHRDAFQGSLHF